MPHYQKVQTQISCPNCDAAKQVIVNYSFDPFPGERGSLHTQQTIGCPRCGYQKHLEYSHDYDAYSPLNQGDPINFSPEVFIANPGMIE